MTDDPELARQFVGGDAASFERVVEVYSPRVAALAFRLMGWKGDADDIVQDVFLAALERRGSFRVESSLGTWLTAITLNRCRSKWRRGLWRRSLWRRWPAAPRAGAAADSSAIADETSAQVRAAVAGLPGRLREVVVLYYLEEMTGAAIREALGLSQTAVEVRLHRGRARLRQSLAGVMEQIRL